MKSALLNTAEAVITNLSPIFTFDPKFGCYALSFIVLSHILYRNPSIPAQLFSPGFRLPDLKAYFVRLTALFEANDDKGRFIALFAHKGGLKRNPFDLFVRNKPDPKGRGMGDSQIFLGQGYKTNPGNKLLSVH